MILVQNNLKQDRFPLAIEENLFYLPMDKLGYIRNISDRRFLSLESKNWFESVKYILIEEKGSFIHSIYLRGSIVNGMFRKGFSDIDVIIIYFDNYQIDKKFMGVINDSLFSIDNNFPKIDLAQKNLIDAQRSPFNFIIKTQSICVHGKNLQFEIESFKVDQKIIYYSYNVKQTFEKNLKNLNNERDFTRIRGICSHLCKNILRTAYETIMLDINKFTRDLYTCYYELQKAYPEMKIQFYNILFYSIYPTCNKEIIFEFVNPFRNWLVEKANLSIKSYENDCRL